MEEEEDNYGIKHKHQYREIVFIRRKKATK